MTDDKIRFVKTGIPVESTIYVQMVERTRLKEGPSQKTKEITLQVHPQARPGDTVTIVTRRGHSTITPVVCMNVTSACIPSIPSLKTAEANNESDDDDSDDTDDMIYHIHNHGKDNLEAGLYHEFEEITKEIQKNNFAKSPDQVKRISELWEMIKDVQGDKIDLSD